MSNDASLLHHAIVHRYTVHTYKESKVPHQLTCKVPRTTQRQIKDFSLIDDTLLHLMELVDTSLEHVDIVAPYRLYILLNMTFV